MRALILSLCLAGTLLGGCATVTNPVTGKTERTVMDERSEIAEGAKAHQEVLAEYSAYPDKAVQAYVNALGQKLARQSHRGNLEWHFTVLDSPEINAFALPGGYVYVTRGIMAYLDSEADLAGVIGHEIGHVTARHGAQRATRQQAAGIGVFAASVLGLVLEGAGVSGAGQVAGQVSQGLAAGYIASYGREQELQADQLGAEYLARNNYDPKNMVDVIQALKNQERYAEDLARAEGRQVQTGQNWLASHPSNDQRLREIREIAGKYPGRYGDDGRERYLRIISGLPFGESREQGVTRGRNFYHEGLGIAITAPSGWKIQNSAAAITLVNGARDAGLVVRLVPPDAGRTHEDIIRKVFAPERGEIERLSLSGLPATRFVGVGRSRDGQQQPVEVTIVSGPANHNFLLAYAGRDRAAIQRARPDLRLAEASFRALTGSDRAAARPWTLRSVPYPAGGFAQLARQSPLTEMAEQQLRLINGYYGGGEPPRGQLVKVVE